MLSSEESGSTATRSKRSFAIYLFNFFTERKEEEPGGKSVGHEMSETSRAKGICR